MHTVVWYANFSSGKTIKNENKSSVKHNYSYVSTDIYFSTTLELKNIFLPSEKAIFIYRTRAIIGRSWLEATLEYKPYIRPKVTVYKWSLEMG